MQITGIGIFEDLRIPQTRWAPLTLIYAENGRGKSTLAHFLRTAADHDAERLLRRKRLGTLQSEPRVRLQLGGNRDVSYDTGIWSGEMPSVRVEYSVF